MSTKTIFAALVLMALTACKNSVKETADIIDLPRAETPDTVAKAMEGFFEQAAADSMDIHSVMIVKDGSVIYSRWQSQGVDSFPALVAATMQGSTETTFYVLAVYFGAVGIQRARHAVGCALFADFVGVVASILVCYWFFG